MHLLISSHFKVGVWGRKGRDGVSQGTEKASYKNKGLGLET